MDSLRHLVLLLAAVALAVGQTNYCTISADHTMCKYKGDGPACKPKSAAGLDSAAQTAVVTAQNNYRRKIAQGQEPKQPAAADMSLLVWDVELAKVAQRWADQCTFGHDTERRDPRFYVGQNVFVVTNPTASNVQGWQDAAAAWYAEVASFVSTNISPFKYLAPVGHYTQVAWAETKSIGCGFSYYNNNTKLYVCNYGPAGNVNGKVMYKVGTACTQCPVGTKCNTGLCG